MHALMVVSCGLLDLDVLWSNYLVTIHMGESRVRLAQAGAAPPAALREMWWCSVMKFVFCFLVRESITFRQVHTLPEKHILQLRPTSQLVTPPPGEPDRYSTEMYTSYILTDSRLAFRINGMATRTLSPSVIHFEVTVRRGKNLIGRLCGSVLLMKGSCSTPPPPLSLVAIK